MAQPTDEQKRLEMCKLELKAVLERYGVDLKGVPVFTPDGRVEVSILFVKAAPKSGQEQSSASSRTE